MQRRYGWKADRPDSRDLKFSIVHENLPSRVDLRPKCPPVYDQGQAGSCTSNAIAGALEFEQMRQGLKAFTPSRLFIYANERIMEGTLDQDCGASLRDGIKVVVEEGAPPETDWPYDLANLTVKPSAVAYANAKKDLVTQYLSVPLILQSMKSCLALGYPFVLGIQVYESFESDEVAHSGSVRMPSSEEQYLGGHAVCCCGYDDAVQTFIMRNSYGAGWGKAGYFLIPYPYLIDPDLAADAWSIRGVREIA